MEQSARNHLERHQVQRASEKLSRSIIRQATINLYSKVWKSSGDSFPKLYCIDLVEAYVTQENVSLEILHEKKRYDSRSPNGHLHEKPLAKGGTGKESQY
jgi:hypothetical protein